MVVSFSVFPCTSGTLDRPRPNTGVAVLIIGETGLATHACTSTELRCWLPRLTFVAVQILVLHSGVLITDVLLLNEWTKPKSVNNYDITE
jgi:hypothetical protein